MDIANYLDRISYEGYLRPSLSVLTRLQQAHALHIPFENLDIHLGIEIRLDLDRIYQKIITNRRGGFCYELNGLFYELITALGFQAKRISASVYSDSKQALGPEFDHLTTIVKIDGVEYLSDVGFGAFPLQPMPIHSRAEIPDPLGLYRIEPVAEGVFDVRQIVDQQDNLLYRFKTTEQAYQNFAAMCHHQQTAPNSHFTKKRLISLKTSNGRVTITGDMLKITEAGVVTVSKLENEADFKQALARYFSVVL